MSRFENIAQPALIAVDVILDLARPIRAPRDLDFGEIDRQPAVAIVEGDRDFGQAQRFALLVAGENDVFHFARAQALLLCSPSTQRNASTRFDLPEPFGPDDRGNAAAELQRRRLGERFESERFDLLELHLCTGSGEWVSFRVRHVRSRQCGLRRGVLLRGLLRRPGAGSERLSVNGYTGREGAAAAACPRRARDRPASRRDAPARSAAVASWRRASGRPRWSTLRCARAARMRAPPRSRTRKNSARDERLRTHRPGSRCCSLPPARAIPRPSCTSSAKPNAPARFARVAASLTMAALRLVSEPSGSSGYCSKSQRAAIDAEHRVAEKLQALVGSVRRVLCA